MIRDAKANFWKNEFSSSNCSKSFWKTVKKFNGSSSTLLTGPLSHKSTIITDDKQKLNLMNDFFASVGERLAAKVESQPPISNSLIPSKVVEHFICTMLNSHLENNNLLSPNQWGFRKKSSTEDLLLHMIEKWHFALDDGKSIAVLFIDYRKAFDSVMTFY